MTVGQRARIELRRSLELRMHPALHRSTRKITEAMPDVVTEFAETTDEELARLIATELDDYVAEAPRADMTDVDSLDILHMAAIAYADGQRSDPGTAELSRHLSNIPVPARLVLAAAILAAADKPVSTVNLCQVAGVSRGSAYNHHKDVMASIRESLPVLVRAQLAVLGETPSAAELFEQVRERDESIRQLRDTVATLRQDRDTALAYARDLHERLRPEFEAIAREKREKVRPLRAVPAPFRRARRPGEVTN